MKTNQYISDIQSQPQELLNSLKAFDPKPFFELSQKINEEEFDRVIITGMGASYHGAYPAWLTLTNLNIPALWLDTSELLHYAQSAITERTLLWLVSQSGQSAEIIALLDKERIKEQPTILATTNDPKSTLAKAADYTCYLNTPVEKTVSTRTSITTFALNKLVAEILIGRDFSHTVWDLQETAFGISNYLTDISTKLDTINTIIGTPENLAILGRGPSYASASYGALILAEAAKYLATPMQAAEFRHGPLEIAPEEVSIILLAGAKQTLELNIELLKDLVKYGAHAFWLSVTAAGAMPEEFYQAGVKEIPAPVGKEAGIPIAEIVPLQLLSVVIAQNRGYPPGEFRFVGKVTTKE